MLFLGAPVALAAPTNTPKGNNNPNVVAFYTTGDHGIVGEYSLHTGADLVMAAGKSGNFQQWFTGNGDGTLTYEGDHSVWKSVGTSTSCPKGWSLVVNAQKDWGSYLQPGNYCVHSNDFK